MNPFEEIARALMWREALCDHISANYTSALEAKLRGYCTGEGPNASSLGLLVDAIANEGELPAFVRYPYVADCLHPRTRLHDDESLDPLVAYGLSFLAFLGVIDDTRAVYRIPVSYQKRLSRRRCPADADDDAAPFPLYFDDYLVFPDMTGGNTVRPLPRHQRQVQAGRVTRSVELFVEISDHVLPFVVRGTELLCIQDELEESGRFGSASFRGFAGLNAILNPQITSTWTLADAILHESIHSVLYQVEPWFCPFFRDKEHARHRVRSPWTGNDISVDNLFQASFVWFGLLHFWRTVRDRTAFDECRDYSLERVHFIGRGFRGLDLGIFGESLSDEVRPGMNLILRNWEG